MPADAEPGMAFVLVQHLAPDHKSILTDLIRRYTRMQVFEVEDGMVVRPNCAYIIPPGRDMAFLNGTLQLLEPSAPRGQRLPIDFFFRSLAQDQRERAICIVLSGTGIATVFVDHRLRILRFTPAATRIINLILSDVGRPVSHIVSNLVGYDSLVADTQAVLDSLVPREVDVQIQAGAWYAMRILPYRTLDNVIEGAVLTFMDITEMQKAQATLRESESRFRQLAASLPQLVWTCRPDGLCDYLGPQWVEFTGVPEA